ncbi:MAG TPA: DUF58 domain-containing protein, partial [Pseudomonas sp.]|nr:DUF58 domain-containing protein [Pseudomonas sp.]
MKPSRALLTLLAGLLGLAILLGALSALGVRLPPALQAFWWGLLLALLGAALVDAGRLRQVPTPRIERQLPGNLPLGRWSEVRLTVHHDYPRPLQLQVFDHLPSDMAFEHLPQRVELHPGEQTQFAYRVRPLLRGHFVFPQCEI